MIKYKINGKMVDRLTFALLHPDVDILEYWELAVTGKRNEMNARGISVIFSLTDEKFNVVTEIDMLFTLLTDVNNMRNGHKKLKKDLSP